VDSLNKIFRDKLIPWAEDNLQQRLVVARPVINRAHLPTGVEITPHKYIGERRPIRARRNAGYRLYAMEWPEDHLYELAAPKLVCVLKGVTDYVAGKYIISCNEGNFLLLPPLTPNTSGGRSHLEGSRRQNGYCELMQMLILRDEIHFYFCISHGEEHFELGERICTVHQRQAVRLFNDFMEEALKNNSSDIKLQEYLFASFFRFVWREVEAGREIYQQFKMPQHYPVEHSIDELRDYLKVHLRESLSLERAAQHMFMSQRQFTRYLRRETGKSFVEILTECRIAEAKRLLEESSASVVGISWLVGFQSVSHFSALFRRHTGSAPGAYREMKRNQKPVKVKNEKG